MQRIKDYLVANWSRLALVFVVCAICVALGVHLDPIGGVAMAAPFMLGEMDVKAIEEMVGKATKTVKETTDRMQNALDQAINESKRIGTLTEKTADECKAASALAKTSQDELKKLSDEMKARMLEAEQKIAQRPANPAGEGKSWGQIVADSENYKAAVKSKAKEMGPVEIGTFHKSPILSAGVQTAAGTVPYLVQAERAAFVPGVERQLIVRNLLPVYSTESPLIEFARENVFTNAAAPQGAGQSPDSSEGVAKAESAITFTFVQSPVITLAHWIPASRQILADAKMLMSYIDQRLRYGLLFEEEREVLTSTGGANSGELNGLINQATVYNRRATADSRLDTMLKAFLQVTLSEYAADGVVMSYVDWTAIQLLKDTTGRYLFGDPTSMNQPRVWGRPVIPSNSMTVGKFLTGAFQLSAALWDREQTTVRISEHHANFFIQNLVAVLAEERIALTVYRPAGLVQGDFGADAGQPG